MHVYEGGGEGEKNKSQTLISSLCKQYCIIDNKIKLICLTHSRAFVTDIYVLVVDVNCSRWRPLRPYFCIIIVYANKAEIVDRCNKMT